jgi:hypothetical protein
MSLLLLLLLSLTDRIVEEEDAFEIPHGTQMEVVAVVLEVGNGNLGDVDPLGRM